MRNLRPCSADEFNRFVAAYTPPLTSTVRNGVQQYEDLSTGDKFPDSLVASFLPATSYRRRATGWRIPVTETVSPLTPPIEG